MSITLSAGCRRRQSAAPKTRRAILAGSGSPSRVGGTLRYVIATPGLGDTVLPPADRCKATASHPREIDGYRGWKRGNRPALGPLASQIVIVTHPDRALLCPFCPSRPHCPDLPVRTVSAPFEHDHPW